MAERIQISKGDLMPKTAYILANGEFPRTKDRINELRLADFIIVCDGAIRHLERHHITPSLIIGDLDSIPKKLARKYAPITLHIAEQNSNDLSKAFYHGLKLGFDSFIILGANGKREDHALANFAHLIEYSQFAKVMMRSDFGEFSIHTTPCAFSTHQGEQLSFFYLDPKIALNSTGLKYPLNGFHPPALYSATLNEALGDEVLITSDHPSTFILYRAYKR